MNSLPQSISGIEIGTRQCEQCGAATRLGDGICLSCFLKEGLEAEQQDSIADFESVLAEADVSDKQWRLGNYEILEEIGRGGMGVIYRARQRHSRRIVALKRVLTYHADSHETLARFRREAEAAASLDHPNILPIYEVNETEDGLPFFSMKLAAGGSLRTAGPVLRNEPRECVRLIGKIARAVEYAHQHGILHRDLQPGNILLDARGEPMVSDFGLAKWLDQESNLTRTLTSLGTPGFIAPEQAEGTSFSPAADIYSLGAILFNLLVGRPPFVGNNALSVIRQAVAKPAPKLRFVARSFDRDLETIVARCLEREPKIRYETAGALAEDLERWVDGRPIIARPIRAPAKLFRWSRRNPVFAGAVAVCVLLSAAVAWLIPQHPQTSSRPPEKSIAILPFQNLTKDQESAFFSDGVQEEILSRLSKVAALKVISRTSTERFAGGSKDTRKIGQALGVANILQGSVQKAADELRVTVQLIDAGTARHVWTETYDRKLSDIFQVERDIASNIARKLEANLTQREAQAVAAQPTSNSAAYELYLKGRYFWNKRNADGLRKALEFFTTATQLDPNYARAYTGIADTYGVMPTYDLCSAKECFPLAKTAALKALQLDDSLAEAHATYGGLLTGEYKWTEARRHLERAIDLDPNYAIAHEQLGLEVLMNLGEVDRGLAELRRAQELDPLSLIINTLLGMAHYRLHEYEQAQTQLRKTLELDPNFHLAREVLAQSFDMQGRFDEAMAECRKALQTSDAPGILATLGHIYARAGDRNEALKVLEQLQQQAQKRVVTAVNFAWMYIALGQKNEAMNWLEKAYDDRSLYGIKLDPFLDPLRDEPRFHQLLARVFSESEAILPAAAAIPEKSIAVLPFENLSTEQENAFFANGVQDEILTSLARVADLKVISRTSVMQYKDVTNRNLREIGQQLGVANVVEGSVQRAGNRVRVNAQLIDARTDKHLWAQTYDGDLTDVFAIQSQIARTIADQLQATISAGEKAALDQPPTTDVVANGLYQKALALELELPQRQSLLEAIRLLEQAVGRDPKFALAYCALSRDHLTLYFAGHDHTPTRRDLAKVALENASRLQPDAGEVHLAAALYYYYGFREYDRARAELELARRTLPNNANVYSLGGAIDRRQGRFSEAMRSFTRAVELNPRDTESLLEAGDTFASLQRYREAADMYKRAVAVAPDNYSVRLAPALLTVDESADLRPLRAELNAILAKDPGAASKIAETMYYCALLERDRPAVDQAIAAMPAEGMSPGAGNFIWPREWYIAWAALTFGDRAAAQPALLATRTTLEKLVKEQPDYAAAWSLLGRVNVALGNKEEGLQQARHAVELLPISKDAWLGPNYIGNLAWAYGWAGEKEAALDQLEKLSHPYISYGTLKLNPEWDPLRGYPRFEQLVASFAPKQRTK